MAEEVKCTLLIVISPTDSQRDEFEDLPAGVQAHLGYSMEELAPFAAEADALLHCGSPAGLLEELWPMMDKLSWVHSRSAGVDTLLTPGLVAKDVRVTNSRGLFSRSLAEWALFGAMYFGKFVSRLQKQQAEHRWEKIVVEEVAERSMAIVGYGDIGRAVARLAKVGFGMRIIALRRRPELSEDDELVDEVLPTSELHRAMAADYVCVAAPLTPETKGMVDEAALRAMQPHGVLINIGRGPVVDQSALIGVLKERAIRGAVLDVFEKEPVDAECPLWDMDNVLMSPHCADRTATFLDDAMVVFRSNLTAFLAGEELRNPVDKAAGY